MKTWTHVTFRPSIRSFWRFLKAFLKECGVPWESESQRSVHFTMINWLIGNTSNTINAQPSWHGMYTAYQAEASICCCTPGRVASCSILESAYFVGECLTAKGLAVIVSSHTLTCLEIAMHLMQRLTVVT